jgi:hypothetical protein
LEALMRRVQPLAPWALLFLIAAMVACGGRPSTFLKSLTVSPSAADGQVQFRASGTRVNGSRLSSVAVLWWNRPPGLRIRPARNHD